MSLHTDIPSREELERLLRQRGDALVSIYLPTSPITPEADAARIVFKNLSGRALEELGASALATRDRDAIAEELEDLHDDRSFWKVQSHSLAVFASAEGLRSFRLPNRLAEAVHVADRFFLKPLLRAVTFPQTAFVLALAEGSVRLLEVTADLPTFEVKLSDLPKDAADAAGKSSITDRSPAGRLQGTEGRKTLVRSYARAVDRALRPALATGDVPLILAAAQPIDAIFRSVSSYPHLAAASIEGSPEGRSDTELGEAARPVLDQIYSTELSDLRRLFEERSVAGRTAVEINDLARAATFGAVETLFVDIDSNLPGTIEEETGLVRLDDQVRSGDYGVLDEVARRTLLADGRVMAVRAEDVPTAASAAAILRYPI